MGGGGGGNDEAASRQNQIETQKTTARDAINAIFGISGTGAGAPSKGSFYTQPTRAGMSGDGVEIQEATGDPIFNEGAYNDAVAKYNATGGATAANATARQASYDKVKDDVLAFEKNKLDTDKEPAARQLNFALLRSGNSGGGLDIDQNNLLTRKYDEGLLNATNDADAASLNAKSSDEQARLNILNQIDAGMDQGSAVAGAQNQLATSAAAATSAAKGQTLGNAFDNAGLLYQTSQTAAGGNDAAALYSRLFGKGGSSVTNPATGFGGTVSRT